MRSRRFALALAVLRTVPFVGVRTNSRGETELSLRASDSRQPAVLLEGVPLTLGWDYRTDASVIPLSAASGIRVGRTLSSLMLGPGIKLNAAMTRRARFPALRELYSGSLQRFVPNPDLKPERLVSSEVSALWQRGAGEVQATLFRQHLDDALVRVTRPDRKFIRVNANAQRTQGLELFGAWRGADRTFLADLTVQDPQLIDQGSGTHSAPEYVPHLRGSVTAIVPIAARTRLTTAVTTIGSQSCLNPDRGTRETIAAATRLDALVDRDIALGARGLWSALRLSVGIDNLLDRLTYDQCGLPQVGRTLRVGLQLR